MFWVHNLAIVGQKCDSIFYLYCGHRYGILSMLWTIRFCKKKDLFTQSYGLENFLSIYINGDFMFTICSVMELDASKQLWGEIDDFQHVTEPTPAIPIKPAAIMTCHIPTLEVSSTDDSNNE